MLRISLKIFVLVTLSLSVSTSFAGQTNKSKNDVKKETAQSPGLKNFEKYNYKGDGLKEVNEIEQKNVK